MSTKGRSKRLILWVGCGLIAVLLMVVLLVFFSQQHYPWQSKAELERIRAELPDAEARWHEHGVADYDIDVQASVALLCVTLGTRTLHVRGGQLVPADEFKPCDFSWLLPPQVFDNVRQELARVNTEEDYLTIQFDPEYGFVSEYHLSCINSSLSDCEERYRFSNLRPVEP